MKKVSLDVWIQLIGMLSVLAGLLFVGLEMRLSQQIALAAQQQERASLVTEIIGTFSGTSPPISFLDFIDENLDLSNANTLGVLPISKDELFKQSDIISLHVVLGDRYKNLISEKEFKQMKKSSFLINTSRGPIINEKDLVKALEDEVIAGAGLDVFEQEPLPVGSPLWSQPNLSLTPHLGGMIDVYVEQAMPILIHNLKAFLSGKSDTMLNLVEHQ